MWQLGGERDPRVEPAGPRRTVVSRNFVVLRVGTPAARWYPPGGCRVAATNGDAPRSSDERAPDPGQHASVGPEGVTAMSDGDVSRYQANWRDEVESAALYRTLAEV